MIDCQTLKDLRLKKNLTVEQLAEAAKLPTEYIKSLENGSKTLSPKMLDRLGKILDVRDIPNMPLQNAGTKIRVLRQRENMTLEQLGVLTELSPTYLSEIERGKRIPPFFTLRRIAEAFNVPISLFVDSKHKTCVIGDKLKKARVHHGLTQAKLADMIGASPGLIAQLENGIVQPSLETLEKLGKSLGVSICYLILEQEEVDEIIGALSQDMRDLLFNPNVQMIIGSICTMSKKEIMLVLNFVKMLNDPPIPYDS